MSKLKTVAKNSFFLFIDRLLRGGLLMALTIWLARVLSLESFGVYSLAVAIGGIFRVVTDFGISFRASYEIAQNHAATSTIFLHGFILKIIFTVIMLVLLIGCVVIVYPAHIQQAIIVAAIAYLLYGFIEYANAVFGGLEKMEYTSLSMVFYMSLVFIIVGLLLVLGIRSVPQLLGGQFVAGFFGVIFTAGLLIRKFSINWVKIDRAVIKKFFIMTLPFGLYFISDIVYFHTDIIMISFMKGEASVGLYQSAMKLVQFLEQAPLLLASALFPTMSRLYKENFDAVKEMFIKGLRWVALLSIPLMVGIGLLSDQFIKLFFGSKFVLAGPVLGTLAIMVPFRHIGFIAGAMITVVGKQKSRTGLVAGTALLNIFLNALMIPRFGLVGAALASVFSAIVLTTGFLYYCKNFLVVREFAESIWRPLLASCVMGIAIWLLKEKIHLVLVVFTGVFIYAFMMVSIKGIIKEDIEMVKRLFKK